MLKPKAKRLTANEAYEKGKDLKDWYEGILSTATFVAGEYALLFIGMLAATSPQRKVLHNTRLAFRALEQFKSGEKWSGFNGKTHTMNLDRLLKGMALSGPKVSAFYLNMTGNPDSITIDRWISRLYTGHEMPTAKERRSITKRIRLASNRLGISPRQYQAAIWCGLKRQSGLDANEKLEPLKCTIMRVYHELHSQSNLFTMAELNAEFDQIARSFK